MFSENTWIFCFLHHIKMSHLKNNWNFIYKLKNNWNSTYKRDFVYKLFIISFSPWMYKKKYLIEIEIGGDANSHSERMIETRLI